MEIINLSLYNVGLSTSKPKTFLRIRETILSPFCPFEGNQSALHLFE